MLKVDGGLCFARNAVLCLSQVLQVTSLVPITNVVILDQRM